MILKQIKNKKYKKGRIKKFEFTNTSLKFGTLGLKTVQSGIIKSNQLYAAKYAINKKIKTNGKIWTNIYPNFPVTSKPIGARMGKGKGSISHWVTKISCGCILFEVSSNNYNIGFSALKAGGYKLPVKTKVIKN